MPTYEYTCDACGVEFELEQRISEPPAKKCPKCGKNKARRMIAQGNFILKGAGWYSDGYSATGGGTSTRSSKPPSTTSESASPKPETKKADAA